MKRHIKDSIIGGIFKFILEFFLIIIKEKQKEILGSTFVKVGCYIVLILVAIISVILYFAYKYISDLGSYNY